MKHVITTTLPEGVEHLPNGATISGGELHFIVPDEVEVPNAVYEAKWDGRSKKLTVLKGSPATLKHAFAGWPMEG